MIVRYICICTRLKRALVPNKRYFFLWQRGESSAPPSSTATSYFLRWFALPPPRRTICTISTDSNSQKHVDFFDLPIYRFTDLPITRSSLLPRGAKMGERNNRYWFALCGYVSDGGLRPSDRRQIPRYGTYSRLIHTAQRHQRGRDTPTVLADRTGNKKKKRIPPRRYKPRGSAILTLLYLSVVLPNRLSVTHYYSQNFRAQTHPRIGVGLEKPGEANL